MSTHIVFRVEFEFDIHFRVLIKNLGKLTHNVMFGQILLFGGLAPVFFGRAVSATFFFPGGRPADLLVSCGQRADFCFGQLARPSASVRIRPTVATRGKKRPETIANVR